MKDEIRTMKKIIKNGIVVTMNAAGDVWDHGYVMFEDTKILAAGPEDELEKTLQELTAQGILKAGEIFEEIDAKRAIVIPGLVNTHCHLGMIPFRGLGDDCKDRLRVFLLPMENQAMDAEMARLSTRYAIGELLLSGVTTVLDMYYFEEVVAKVMDEMGMELQVENMGFDYLLTSLAKGDYDIVMAAMEATEKRLNSADFSDPYYTDIPPMILVKADAADQYATLADFAGKSVGAQSATTKEGIVTDQMEGASLVSLQLVTDLVNELVYGKIDAVVLDGAVAQEYVDANPDLAIASASSELGEAQPYCIAVAKGDPKGLLPGINAAIAKMTSENKIDEFIADADALSGVAVEVTADAPAA